MYLYQGSKFYHWGDFIINIRKGLPVQHTGDSHRPPAISGLHFGQRQVDHTIEVLKISKNNSEAQIF